MSWPTNPRPARSLVVLLEQINTMFPKRSKASDGMIADAAHAARVSDHNPNAQGVVTALDVTHDPGHGLDIQKLADSLVASNDPRIKYIIANRRIWEPPKGWLPYTGSDPHTNHLHVSVKASNADIVSGWRLEEEDMYAGKTAYEWAEIAGNAAEIADIRLLREKRYAATVSVPETDADSEKGVLQAEANVITMAKRIDQLTRIVSSEGDAASKIDEIKEILGR